MAEIIYEPEKNVNATNEEDIERIQIVRNLLPENITEYIKKQVLKTDIKESKTKLAQRLINKLEKNFGAGWNIFLGKHFFGLCTYEDKFCIEFVLDDVYRVILFKSFLPKK
ncbi:hypothetical protein DMUE_1704 [Dictyocoela muelleri]|nr:hypothetical protein DMUE_1704 [Dictyocoela muelleri]